MGIIGMTEAGKRIGVSRQMARRVLVSAEVPLVYLSASFLGVEEADLEAFISQRKETYRGPGRPPGSKNKPKKE